MLYSQKLTGAEALKFVVFL